MSQEIRKPKIDRIIEGLQLIKDAEPDAMIASDHDVFWAGSAKSMLAMTMAQRHTMRDLGWRWIRGFKCWEIFT